MRLALLLAVLPLALAAQAPQPVAPATPEQLFRAGKLDELRAVAQSALAKNKSDPVGFYWLGRVADAQDKSAEAVDWFEKAAKYDDKNSNYHFWLGSALGDEAQKAGKLRQPFLARRVKNEFERAVLLDGKNINARQGLVDFYSIAPSIMGGSIDKAKEQAAEIIKLDPMRGHMAMARLAQRQKDVPGEERAYKAAVAAAPDSVVAEYQLAAFYRRQSRWDDAFATYEHLIKTKVEEAFAHAGWGFTAAQSGKNLERGEREIRYFLANLPKDVPPVTMSAAHFRLGQIMEKTGRKELARSEYTEAVKLNPQNTDAKKALDALK